MKIYISLLFLVSFLVTQISAQFFNAGQAPTSVKWMQIKTENFQIIYPRGFYKEANRSANILEYMYEYSSEDLEHQPRKISVLLYNQSTLSNGFVTWAPKRSEWIATPPTESYAQDWLEQLALHEFRHVVQIDKLDQGFTRVLHFVFGEMAVGGMLGFTPLWFLEGDATVNETAMSSTGRGRQPDFSKHLRAIEIETSKRYSYDQSYLGSYKHFIPDHYKYGYQMVAYGKLKYTSKLWSNTLDKVGRRPFIGAPFYFGLKNNGAGSKVNLYEETFDSLKAYWNNNINKVTETNTSSIYHKHSEHYTNYIFPQATIHGIVAAKTGIDDITRFVLLADSSEKIIHTPGRYYGSSFSADDKYMVWEENIPNLRWQQVSYSIIKRYDFETGKEKSLSKKSRYFTPSLLKNRARIACVEVDEANRYYIVLLNARTGECENRIPFEEGEYVFTPQWIDENTLAIITQNSEGKRLETLSLKDGKREVLYNSGRINIAQLSVSQGWIYFTRDSEMARNIHTYSFESDEVYRITQSKIQADFPSFNAFDSTLIFSEYTLEGFHPVKLESQSIEKTPVEKIDGYTYAWADELSKSAGTNLQKVNYMTREYDSVKYSRALHVWNIHSWLPFYIDLTDFFSYDQLIKPGVMLLMQNKLSTVTADLSYFYVNGTNNIAPRVTWQGLFPVFELSAQFTDNPAAIRVDNSVSPPENIQNYYSFTARTYLLLNFSRNKYYRSLQPSIGYTYSNAYYISDDRYKLGRNYLDFSIQGNRQLKMSHRDLFPRFAQSAYILYRVSLSDPNSFGGQSRANLDLYFPGFIPHHSTKINFGFENLEYTQYPLTNSLSLPRGYSDQEGIYYNEIVRSTIEYYFPFLYPDWSLGPLAYIKRFHASIFSDQASVKYYRGLGSDVLVSDSYWSIGVSLGIQTHFLRFFVPFTPKFTFAYLPFEPSYYIGFGISIDSSIF